ncbi:hypothetical protein PN462_12560 [Spirulina sp. CS-785/01]|uniref:hypothetical protein n=1 Tax=Spirulina sp. CS-785/01 TaxID=3021716 RepID=UPI00232B401D|nr:hypothetical protein [Spirulina sp. CS-785/01]MDB9313937.1 hypothetical protein [Spirulina sp. CS-785/01]
MSQTPLTGTELMNCAKASATQGIEAAAQQCGYGEDCDRFFQALQKAGQDMGIEITQFSDIITSTEIAEELARIRSL